MYSRIGIYYERVLCVCHWKRRVFGKSFFWQRFSVTITYSLFLIDYNNTMRARGKFQGRYVQFVYFSTA